ncbi:DUF4232 domain-containing protein [Streptomyces barringtoniae]|uniref:DUF4232 domain-containing protein n=1 Tax=Streptomyces barringtoniae TaxID=2892029 RepID=UPI001E45B3FF|nr:DUF4232 domain-containing protein [Streptomyces barringtoniae]MCC5474812.1 DUF4232 domain-containing protein [Streptomyces barringtoniae]
MHHRNTIRLAASATAVIAAALSLTACGSGDGDGAGKSSSPTPAAATPSGIASTAASPAATPPSTSGSSGGTSTAPSAAVSPASHTSAGTASACPVSAVQATAQQGPDNRVGTGTGTALIQFTNVSGHACVLQGHPSVAGAGNGSPEHNSPLKVTPTGQASPVRLAPGGKAWVKLTFVQVEGEGDGYCVSGAKPAVYPTLVVGFSGSGAHQVALSDGEFAECDNTVTATAVSAAKPA